MSKIPVLKVGFVSVKEDDGRYVMTLGSGKIKARYEFDETHYMLMIVEYAQARGISLPSFEPDGEVSEAKPWTPWVVPKK